MSLCPACGHEDRAGAKFCPECGAALDGRTSMAREERKVVSVLFCDLVGFTAASDQADPEDVRARLRPYHAQLQRVIENYGGTVEKFVGDAVMAVFGAPLAHEDDAERAVRAGLRILEAIEELNRGDEKLQLQVRVGINTGEAVVALGAHPERGEGFVTGDVVNTASRLQGIAPVNGVAVSGATFRQTERAFTFVRLEPAQVKGKTEPLSVWQPLAARARFGADVIRTSTTPLVGREFERPQMIATFERRGATFMPTGDRGGRTRCWQDPPLHRAVAVHRAAAGAGALAPGAVSSVRRGNRLLGTRGDRQGGVRHPRVGFPRGGVGQARPSDPRG
jgi:class 3 adenylate cyclase